MQKLTSLSKNNIPKPDIKTMSWGRVLSYIIELESDDPDQAGATIKHTVQIVIKESDDHLGKNADVNMHISHGDDPYTQAFDWRDSRTVNDKKIRKPMASMSTTLKIFKHRKAIMIDYLNTADPHSLVSQAFKRDRSRIKLYDRHFRDIGKKAKFILKKFNPGEHDAFFYYFLLRPQNTREQNKKSMLFWLPLSYTLANLDDIK